jgi:uncharacterized cupredoxin-like copper-binding protein
MGAAAVEDTVGEVSRVSIGGAKDALVIGGVRSVGRRVARTMRRAIGRVKRSRRAFRAARHRLAFVSTSLRAIAAAAGLAACLVAAACQAERPPSTPLIVAGSSDAPREVNLIARDYSFQPATLDLIPGETILLHVVNGGLAVHEAIIGDSAVQQAWEIAEAAAADPPPGPTPRVSVPPEAAGLRIVVASGERVDVVWTVPTATTALIVGCHIAGHWGQGMQIPVRWVPSTSP